MAFPENIQKLPVGYSIRIVIYLESLGMITKAVIGGVFLCAPAVSNARANNSIDSPEPGIRSPESAQSESSRCCLCRRGGINGRQFFFLPRMCVVGTYHFSTSGNGINAWNVVLVKDKIRNGKSKTNQDNNKDFDD
jgi:hypothetical protein